MILKNYVKLINRNISAFSHATSVLFDHFYFYDFWLIPPRLVDDRWAHFNHRPIPSAKNWCHRPINKPWFWFQVFLQDSLKLMIILLKNVSKIGFVIVRNFSYTIFTFSKFLPNEVFSCFLTARSEAKV